MPGEMILKQKWDTYFYIKKKYYGHSFALTCIEGNNNQVNPNKTIWFYWDKGLNNSPLIVKKCYESLIKNCPEGWTIITLTHKSVKEYIKLPQFIEELLTEGKMWYALYADLIRLSLLYKYGGIWCDATCLLTQEIPSYVINEPLFMFSYKSLLTSIPTKFENWFIKADKGNYVIQKILENLLYYWSHPRKKQEYFVWFHIQSALYEKDETARNLMDKIYYVFNYDAMIAHLHYGLNTIYTDKIWNNITSKCFVQKLTYKYNHEIEQSNKKNILQHIFSL